MSTLAETVRRRLRRTTERQRALELVARGRIQEARAIVAQLDGPVAAIEVNQTTPYLQDGRRVFGGRP